MKVKGEMMTMGRMFTREDSCESKGLKFLCMLLFLAGVRRSLIYIAETAFFFIFRGLLPVLYSYTLVFILWCQTDFGFVMFCFPGGLTGHCEVAIVVPICFAFKYDLACLLCPP